MKFLTYLATADGHVKRASLEALTRCRELADAHGGTSEAVVVAPDAASYVDTARRHGAATVYTVADEAFAQHLNRPLLDALERVIERAGPDVVAFASTEAVKDVLGALAARLEAAAVPDAVAFDVRKDGTVEALRPVMAAKYMARTETTTSPALVSLRPGSYEHAEAPGEAEEVPVDFAEAPDPGLDLREVIASSGDGVDLAEASAVVAAGRGVRDEEGKALVEDLAQTLGAAIGATRAVVEDDLFPAAAQIGQTGKTVSPDLYVAVGISGAIQHVAGMQSSRTIVAINKDPDAPIFDVATYGLVGDLYDIVPALTEALKGS